MSIFSKNADDDRFFVICDLHEERRISSCRNRYFCWNNSISKLLIRTKYEGHSICYDSYILLKYGSVSNGSFAYLCDVVALCISQ
jgi:hypothetical protein